MSALPTPEISEPPPQRSVPLLAGHRAGRPAQPGSARPPEASQPGARPPAPLGRLVGRRCSIHVRPVSREGEAAGGGPAGGCRWIIGGQAPPPPLPPALGSALTFLGQTFQGPQTGSAQAPREQIR